MQKKGELMDSDDMKLLLRDLPTSTDIRNFLEGVKAGEKMSHFVGKGADRRSRIEPLSSFERR
jgi:hypothetical protein